MSANPPALRRRLGLPLLVLYGTGVTVGAGIYVLIGPVAGRAGAYAPFAFVLAALVMGLTVASYAELCTRYPVAAGEAAYIKGAFGSRVLSTLTGLAMIATAVVASATVALGAAGYIAQFVTLPTPVLVIAIVAVVGLISAWGILESVLLASLFTLVELGGLLAIIVAAARAGLPIADALLAAPPLTADAWAGIGAASLLAFFAFIGFEDLTNIVEEARRPQRDIPLAMVITLGITTVLYVLVAAVALTALPAEQLAASAAPLSLVFSKITTVSPAAISAVAVVATLNTIIAEMTMATRVVYGMARLGDLPDWLSAVNKVTATPLAATAIIAVAVMALAMLVPLEPLAEFTSTATLTVFALVNAALLKLRRDGDRAPPGTIRIPLWMPILGLISSIAMVMAALL